MTEGVCFFAYNNEHIDYVKLALFAAKKVKKYLNRPVCLITDQGSWDWLIESHGNAEIKKYITDVVITDDELEQNTRNHYDSPWTQFNAQFSNSNKHKVFEYTPYKKTLLLDIDYILKSDFLEHAFTSYTGVSMFDDAISMRNRPMHMHERRLFLHGIKMWWSTVVYFDQSETSKLFFDTWEYVKDNYDYYKFLYNFPGGMYRTDFCVSIAAHIMNGMALGQEINNFGGIPMQNLSGKDDIVESLDDETWIVLAHDPKENWKNIMVRHEKSDVHCMNKRALDRIIVKHAEQTDDT